MQNRANEFLTRFTSAETKPNFNGLIAFNLLNDFYDLISQGVHFHFSPETLRDVLNILIRYSPATEHNARQFDEVENDYRQVRDMIAPPMPQASIFQKIGYQPDVEKREAPALSLFKHKQQLIKVPQAQTEDKEPKGPTLAKT